jgi:hypothetical protein
MPDKIVMKVSILSEMDQNKLYKVYMEYPNWFQLGEAVRREFNDIRITQNWPNDYQLGKVIHNFFEEKN